MLIAQKMFCCEHDAIVYAHRKRLSEENYKTFFSAKGCRLIYIPKWSTTLPFVISCADGQEREKPQFFDYLDKILQKNPTEWTPIELRELENHGLVIVVDSVNRHNRRMYRIREGSVEVLTSWKSVPACVVLNFLNDGCDREKCETFRYFYEKADSCQGARFYGTYIPGVWKTEFLIDPENVEEMDSVILKKNGGEIL